MTGNGLTGEELNVKADASGPTSSLTVSGTSYNLLQFHFHTEAEHLINGVRPEMELHIVHRDPISNDYLVVGLLVDVGAENTALSPFFDNLPTEATIGAFSHSIPSFNLNSLIPSTTHGFRYTGSLTTTPYTEGVNWVVLNERLTISQAQLDAFRDLFPEGNSREAQALNGRVILTDVAGFAVIPEPSAYASVASLLALAFALNKRRRA